MFKSPTQSPPGTPSSSSSSVLNSSGSGSRYSRPPSVVIETLHAKTSENSAGQKKINQYTLEKEIGHGAFGTVHIAVDTSGNVYVCVVSFCEPGRSSLSFLTQYFCFSLFTAYPPPLFF